MSHTRNARALLTPAMRGVLDRMARARRPPLHALTPAQARAAYEAGASLLEPPPHKLPQVTDLSVATHDGQTLPARLYMPDGHGIDASDAPPVLLYFHGGGFTVGSVETHDILCRHLCHLAHCAVVSVGYRLAPEAKFPVAVHDARDSLAWLRTQAQALGLDGRRMAVGGDSAGGTLAAVCAIMARDAHWPLALQLLFYPGCASHQDSASHRQFAQGFHLEKEHLDYFFGHYLRGPADRADWRFAPLDGCDASGQRRELDGVAPVWMGLAECDPLVDEGLLYADRLRMAGVPVDIEIYRGVVHGFINMGRAIPEALVAHADAARALRHAFSRT